MKNKEENENIEFIFDTTAEKFERKILKIFERYLETNMPKIS